MSAHRIVLAALFSIALVAFAACGDAEEQVGQETTPTGTSSPISTTPSSATPTTPVADSTPTPGPSNLTTYVSPGEEFAVDYASDLSTEELAPTTKIRDFISGVEFHDSGGLLRASVYVYRKSAQESLEEWVEGHNPAFFEREIEESTIDGRRALLNRLNFQGVPSPLAYVDRGDHVVAIKGLLPSDFDDIADQIRFDP